MEKTWCKKLSLVLIDYYVAVDRDSENVKKIKSRLLNWENTCRDALLVANNLEFEEILSWNSSIAEKLKTSYFNILRKKANSDSEKLLVSIFSAEKIELIAISEDYDLTLLAQVTEQVINEKRYDEKIRLNILTIINNRPDVLTLFKIETFENLHLSSGNASFLKDEKINCLLKFFTESKDYQAFIQKININEHFSLAFNNADSVVEARNKLSDLELQNFSSPLKVVEIFENSSQSWKNNLDNFKKVIKLMDFESIKLLIPLINANFYNEVALIAQEGLIKKLLKSETINVTELKEIHYTASNINTKISKIKRKVIKKFLE